MKQIKYYDNYRITDNGVIYNKNGKELRLKNRKKGYKSVILYRNGIPKTFLVHRLVMCTYNYVDGYEKLDVNHIDGDTSNNYLKNLEWCTRKKNMEHAVRLGLVPRGESHHLSKLSDEDVNKIRLLFNKGLKQKDIARMYSVDASVVSRYINRKRGGSYR